LCDPFEILWSFFQSLHDDNYSNILDKRVKYDDKIFRQIKLGLEKIRRLMLNNTEKNLIYKEIEQIIGMGLGSTPESDDIFMGFITAFSLLNPDINVQYLAKIPFENMTTTKSSRLLRSIIRKNYPKEINKFVFYLKQKKTKNKLKFEMELKNIANVGSSTGINFLRGVLFEFETRLKNSNK